MSDVPIQESLLVEPYGGRLVNLVVSAEERADVARRAAELPPVQISERSMCDFELLVTGGFSLSDGSDLRSREHTAIHTHVV